MIHQCIAHAIPAQREFNNGSVYRHAPVDPRTIVKRLREERGFPSDRALATAAGISQPTLARYLAGTTETMEMHNWLALAQTLGVTLSELLGEVPLTTGGAVREIVNIVEQLDDRGQETMLTVGRALLDKQPTPR